MKKNTFVLLILFSLVLALPAWAKDTSSDSKNTTSPQGFSQRADITSGGEAAWNPFAEMENLQMTMEELFNRSLDRLETFRREGNYRPEIDLMDAGDHYQVKADLPGMSREDINLQATRNELIISGERLNRSETEQNGFYKAERSFGTFSRSISFPNPIEADKISAKYENGVLDIVIPKAPEHKSQPKKIEVA